MLNDTKIRLFSNVVQKRQLCNAAAIFIRETKPNELLKMVRLSW